METLEIISPQPAHLFGADASLITHTALGDGEADATPAELIPLDTPNRDTKSWMPKRVLFTPAALEYAHGRAIYRRVCDLGLPIEKLKTNRITGLRGADERETYKLAKQTMAVVVAPPSAMRLQPIPPSADWQFHLAEGCPAHCQYCYLAGSLSGPPVVRVFANLPEILENTRLYEKPDSAQSFEVSCYTDPLALEHLTGSLSACITHFGTRPNAALRWVSKFDAVAPLVGLEHNGRTRCRASLNIPAVTRRFEGGVARLENRLNALRTLALPRERGGGGYPVGAVIAPIIAAPGWQEQYAALLDDLAAHLYFPCDLTFELITHRFTPGSKDVLMGWYPASALDMDESTRDKKRNKFGGFKYTYIKQTMTDLKAFFHAEIPKRFPDARILYFT